ncbi:MAG: hypothetical protein AAFU77_16955 [Myxococcota bacterium]
MDVNARPLVSPLPAPELAEQIESVTPVQYAPSGEVVEITRGDGLAQADGLEPTDPAPPRTPVERYDAALEALREDGYSVPSRARTAFASLERHEQNMLLETLGHIEGVQAGTLDRGDYLAAVLDSAERLSEGDSDEFVSLVHLAMNRHSMGFGRDTARGLAGAGWRPAGSEVQDAYQFALDELQLDSGLNPNVRDSDKPFQALGQHFGEFLAVGHNRFDWAGRAMQEEIDAPRNNPGDYRSGMLAVSIGGGLARGEISVADANRLMQWALIADQSPPPPWGNEASTAVWLPDTRSRADRKRGEQAPRPPESLYLRDSQLSLEHWVSHFNAAFPNAPIHEP